VIGTVFWLLFTLFSKEQAIFDILQQLLSFIWGWAIYPILAVVTSRKIIQEGSRKLIGLILGATISSVTLFMVPLLFWASGITPSYQITIVLAVFVAFLPIRYTYQQVRAYSSENR
jgi:hypothetical protein